MDAGKSLGGKKIAKRKSEGKLNASSDQKRSARQMTAEPLVDTDGSPCEIRVLNDDCLMHIFSFLSKMERLGIERVCSQWQECSMRMWRCTKHLDFHWLPFYVPFTKNNLRQVISRCGPRLQSLELDSKMVHLANDSVLKLIAEECPNLRCLGVSNFDLQRMLNELYGIANQLQRIIFYNCNLTDKNLTDFFPLCPALISVSLDSNDMLTSNSLSKLNSKVEELTIDSCDGIYISLSVEHFSRFQCLKKLSMNDIHIEALESSRLNDILKNLTQLETLCMDKHYRVHMPVDYGINVHSMTHLTGLVSLTCSNNGAINDEMLRAISKHCKNMEILDISCNDITDAGIEYLTRMHKQVDLKMGRNDRLAVSLAGQRKMKKISCHSCLKLTDFGCSRLVSMCNDLEQFDIRLCKGVTMKFILAANSAVNKRTNGVALTLLVGGASIKKNRVPDDIDPQLHLDFAELWW